MGSLGPTELIIILGILVLLFGARKLPELGGSVGKSIKNFKRGIADADSESGSAASQTASTGRVDSADAQRAEPGRVELPPRADDRSAPTPSSSSSSRVD